MLNTFAFMTKKEKRNGEKRTPIEESVLLSQSHHWSINMSPYFSIKFGILPRFHSFAQVIRLCTLPQSMIYYHANSYSSVSMKKTPAYVFLCQVIIWLYMKSSKYHISSKRIKVVFVILFNYSIEVLSEDSNWIEDDSKNI